MNDFNIQAERNNLQKKKNDKNQKLLENVLNKYNIKDKHLKPPLFMGSETDINIKNNYQNKNYIKNLISSGKNQNSSSINVSYNKDKNNAIIDNQTDIKLEKIQKKYDIPQKHNINNRNHKKIDNLVKAEELLKNIRSKIQKKNQKNIKNLNNFNELSDNESNNITKEELYTCLKKSTTKKQLSDIHHQRAYNTELINFKNNNDIFEVKKSITESQLPTENIKNKVKAINFANKKIYKEKKNLNLNKQKFNYTENELSGDDFFSCIDSNKFESRRAKSKEIDSMKRVLRTFFLSEIRLPKKRKLLINSINNESYIRQNFNSDINNTNQEETDPNKTFIDYDALTSDFISNRFSTILPSNINNNKPNNNNSSKLIHKTSSTDILLAYNLVKSKKIDKLGVDEYLNMIIEDQNYNKSKNYGNRKSFLQRGNSTIDNNDTQLSYSHEDDQSLRNVHMFGGSINDTHKTVITQHSKRIIRNSYNSIIGQKINERKDMIQKLEYEKDEVHNKLYEIENNLFPENF